MQIALFMCETLYYKLKWLHSEELSLEMSTACWTPQLLSENIPEDHHNFGLYLTTHCASRI